MRFFPLIPALLLGAPLMASVLQVDVTGIVHPVTVEIITAAIAQAQAEHDDALLVRLSTPGGLLDSTREVIEQVLHSPAPVLMWVGPAGARAASAGFFLLESGDVAAMAPGTNTGASHPVSGSGANLDSVMNEKVENDTAALVRTLAAHRGHNVDAAEKTVRSSVSYTETEALDQHLIDLIAATPAALLEELNGREITRFDGRKQTLHFVNENVVLFEPSLRQKILSAIADPNIALLLLVLGAIGVYAEFSVPGAIFPGVLGAILLLLGFAALAMFPIGWLGATLCIMGLTFFVLEAKFATHGILTAGGAIALLLGAMLLVDTNDPALRVRFSMALAVTIPFALITSFLLSIAVRARRNKVVTGIEAMPGRFGIVVAELNPAGRVRVQGEYWDAVAEARIGLNERVKVTAVDGLTLHVEAAPEPKEGELCR
ncbi:MAG TPA: nodulation protein NfeD [Bryobacteraceae bacterium]|nr:nodulation protein NfeD [Bryobacteraceae bacterium]